MNVSPHEMNELLAFISSHDISKISDEFIFSEFNYINHILVSLLGYEVKMEVEDEHTSDTTLVDYKFTFISPYGEETKILTKMSIDKGFNIKDYITIK